MANSRTAKALTLASGRGLTTLVGLVSVLIPVSLVRVGCAAVVFGMVAAGLLSFAGLLDFRKLLRRLVLARSG